MEVTTNILKNLVDTYFHNNCGENVYNLMVEAREHLAKPRKEPSNGSCAQWCGDEKCSPTCVFSKDRY